MTRDICLTRRRAIDYVLCASCFRSRVAASTIREMDRERVTFIVHTIVHPPKREDAPRREGRGVRACFA